MKLAGQRVMLYLNGEGEEYLNRIANFPFIKPLVAEVTETDDLGLWIRKGRPGDQTSALLLRWQFVLGMEASVETGKAIGWKG
jgi:hypothetical protein